MVVSEANNVVWQERDIHEHEQDLLTFAADLVYAIDRWMEKGVGQTTKDAAFMDCNFIAWPACGECVPRVNEVTIED